MDMNQNDCDIWVQKQSKEEMDEKIIEYFIKLHQLEAKKVYLEDELLKTNIGLDFAHVMLNHWNESYRKIGREMPEKPQREEAEQNGSLGASMQTVVAGSHETRSETAPNPYLVAGLPSGY